MLHKLFYCVQLLIDCSLNSGNTQWVISWLLYVIDYSLITYNVMTYVWFEAHQGYIIIVVKSSCIEPQERVAHFDGDHDIRVPLLW